jgi:very-short-patch-repair endonuclease
VPEAKNGGTEGVNGASPVPLAGVDLREPIDSLRDSLGNSGCARTMSETATDETHRVAILGSRNKIVVSGSREQRIAAIARHQRGRVSRDQLVAVGLSAGAIQRRLRRGVLLAEHPRVYLVGHVAAVPLGPETAALLSVRDGAVLSHHSAAALWRIGAADRNIHILVRGGYAGRRSGVKIHRTRLLEAPDIRIRDGLPVTSPARTLLDRAGAMSMRALEHMFTEAVTLKLVSRADLEDIVARGGGRSGCGAVRALLEEESDPAFTRSDGEKRMRALVREAGLPQPLVNAPLHGFEVDFYWPAHAVVVEIDSYGFHTSRWAYERDRDKDAVLRSHGMPPLRFSRRQVRDEPLLVITQVAQAIAAGGAWGAAPPPSTPIRAGPEAAAR